MHARVGEDIDLSMEQGFEVLTQTDEIEQRTSSFHFDKEVDVTAPVVVAARDRTKQADVPGAVSGRKSKDFLPLVLQVHVMPTSFYRECLGLGTDYFVRTVQGSASRSFTLARSARTRRCIAFDEHPLSEHAVVPQPE